MVGVSLRQKQLWRSHLQSKSKFPKKILISALSLSILSLQALAIETNVDKFLFKEGFSSQIPLGNITTAWESTFMFEFLNYGSGLSYGSTSVVFKEERNGEIYLGLLTNRHVYRPMPQYEMNLYKNIKQYNATYIPVTESAQKLESVQYVSSTLAEGFDLALIVVQLSIEEGQNIKALQFSESCQLKPGAPLTAIGFPKTIDRVANKLDKKNEQVWRMKRWSSGVFVGDKKEGARGPLVGTTLDALPGSSGGPILDSEGKLVGLMTIITGQKYNGDEESNNLKSYSYMVDCQAAKDFAQKSWQEFLQR